MGEVRTVDILDAFCQLCKTQNPFFSKEARFLACVVGYGIIVRLIGLSKGGRDSALWHSIKQISCEMWRFLDMVRAAKPRSAKPCSTMPAPRRASAALKIRTRSLTMTKRSRIVLSLGSAGLWRVLGGT